MAAFEFIDRPREVYSIAMSYSSQFLEPILTPKHFQVPICSNIVKNMLRI